MNDQSCRQKSIMACFLVLFLMLLVMGCIPRGPSPGHQQQNTSPREKIGVLEVMGDQVSLNNEPATSGMIVYSGDNVSTGDASKAIVRFSQGGFLELDQNTDPDLIRKAYCLLIRIFSGQVYVEGRDICIETPESESFLDSAVNVRVLPGLTIATVYRGRLTLQRPENLIITRNGQVRIRRTSVDDVRSLPGLELDRIIDWREARPWIDHSRSKSDMCREYANTAVRQNQENLKRRCGFTGPRWSSDFQGHFQWCLQVPEKMANTETRARNRALKSKCRGHDQEDQNPELHILQPEGFSVQ